MYGHSSHSFSLFSLAVNIDEPKVTGEILSLEESDEEEAEDNELIVRYPFEAKQQEQKLSSAAQMWFAQDMFQGLETEVGHTRVAEQRRSQLRARVRRRTATCKCSTWFRRSASASRR